MPVVRMTRIHRFTGSIQWRKTIVNRRRFLKRHPLTAAILCSLASGLITETVRAEGVLEEIIVTATKREESLQDIPVSITALKGEDLEELRIGNFQDYVNFLPKRSQPGNRAGTERSFHSWRRNVTNRYHAVIRAGTSAFCGHVPRRATSGFAGAQS